MATSSTRQRKLARAKFDRQQARRAENLARRRQVRAAAAGLLAVALVVVGGFWLGGAFDKEPEAVTASADCNWSKQDPSANPNLTDEGLPPTSLANKFGTSTLTLALGTGNVTAKLNKTLAQCGIASIGYLAGKGYYNGTKCFELTNGEAQFALRCGDKSGTGNGGAAYSIALENIPLAADPNASPTPSASADPSATPAPSTYVRYKRGTIAMNHGTNGSQFLIFFKDSTTPTNYSVIGEITSGLDILDKIVEAGVKAGSAAPTNDVVVQTLTVTDDPAASETPAASPTPSASTAN